jgi:hypothetical protein
MNRANITNPFML